MNLGAFIQVYENKKSSEFVLKNFRQNYPNSPITIISDNGSDYTDLSIKYNCNYIHSYMNIGKPGDQISHKKSELKYPVKFAFNEEEIIVFLYRFYKSCEFSIKNGCDFIIMLEDDVFVNKPISLEHFTRENTGMIGSNYKNDLNDDIVYFLKGIIHNVDTDGFYSCGGGTIFDAKIFYDNFDKIILFINKNYKILFNLEPNIGWLDCFLHLIYNFLGKKYTVSNQYVDITKSQYIKLNDNLEKSVYNPYKFYYDK